MMLVESERIRATTRTMSPDAPSNVILVDDSKLVQSFVSSALEQQGIKVHVSDDIWIAGLIARTRPELVLMDVCIGKANIDGTMAVKALKAHKVSKGTKIVLFSDRPVAELENLAATCGADGYICKTNDAGRLVAEVRRFIRMVEPHQMAQG